MAKHEFLLTPKQAESLALQLLTALHKRHDLKGKMLGAASIVETATPETVAIHIGVMTDEYFQEQQKVPGAWIENVRKTWPTVKDLELWTKIEVEFSDGSTKIAGAGILNWGDDKDDPTPYVVKYREVEE